MLSVTHSLKTQPNPWPDPWVHNGGGGVEVVTAICMLQRNEPLFTFIKSDSTFNTTCLEWSLKSSLPFTFNKLSDVSPTRLLHNWLHFGVKSFVVLNNLYNFLKKHLRIRLELIHLFTAVAYLSSLPHFLTITMLNSIHLNSWNTIRLQVRIPWFKYDSVPIWLLWTIFLYLVPFSRYSTSKFLGFGLWPLQIMNIVKVKKINVKKYVYKFIYATIIIINYSCFQLRQFGAVVRVLSIARTLSINRSVAVL